MTLAAAVTELPALAGARAGNVDEVVWTARGGKTEARGERMEVEIGSSGEWRGGIVHGGDCKVRR